MIDISCKSPSPVHMSAYSELPLKLSFTAVSWQTPLKYGYEFPASENNQTSNFKPEDTSSSFLRNVGMCQCYNIISQSTVKFIFTAALTSELREQDQFVYCIKLIGTEFLLEQQNSCQRIQRLLLNSTFRCLLHNSQPYAHTPIVLFKLQINAH